jgi:hypothetical protein
MLQSTFHTSPAIETVLTWSHISATHHNLIHKQSSRSYKNFSIFKIVRNLKFKLFNIYLSLSVKFDVAFVFFHTVGCPSPEGLLLYVVENIHDNAIGF